jgi:hypothetical protein
MPDCGYAWAGSTESVSEIDPDIESMRAMAEIMDWIFCPSNAKRAAMTLVAHLDICSGPLAAQRSCALVQVLIIIP